MKKIVGLICLIISHGSVLPVQAKPTITAAPEQTAAKPSPVKPLTFSEYQSVVSKVDLKDHTMSLNEMEKRLNDLVVLDLRSPEEFSRGHIKGAISFGADISKERLEKFVPDKKSTVVIYCTNNLFPSRRLSLNFASLPQIMALGYANSFVLEDLWQASSFEAVKKLKEGPLWEAEAKGTPENQ